MILFELQLSEQLDQKLKQYSNKIHKLTKRSKVLCHHVKEKGQKLYKPGSIHHPDAYGMRATKNTLVRLTESVSECISAGQLVMRKHSAPTHSSSTVVSACVTHESHCLDNMFFKIIDQDDDWTNRGFKEATAIEMLKLDSNVDED